VSNKPRPWSHRSDRVCVFADKAVLAEVIGVSKIMEEERKQLTSLNLALVLVHDLLLSGGIQAGDGPVKQAVLRHKTRLRSELQKIKIKRGVKSHVELAQGADSGAGTSDREDVSSTC
jgi:putative methyltransferase